MAPVVWMTCSTTGFGSANRAIQSIPSSGPAIKPSNDMVTCHKTFPVISSVGCFIDSKPQNTKMSLPADALLQPKRAPALGGERRLFCLAQPNDFSRHLSDQALCLITLAYGKERNFSHLALIG